jgi:arginase
MAVVGVPSAAGARSPGVSDAPFALRQAGLLEALGQGGARVVNLSDLSLFSYALDAEHPDARNASAVVCAMKAIRDEMPRALVEGFTLVLGGDCTLVGGVAGGMRDALGQPVGLIYLDADADLNTPDTSPSGILNGMALAIALGEGPRELIEAGGTPPVVRAQDTVLLGFRATDPGETLRLSTLAWAATAEEVRRLGVLQAADRALGIVPGAGPILVHLDVDVIDPTEMPAKDVLTPGPGLSFDETSRILSRLLASPRVHALLVTEYHPGKDPDGKVAARLTEAIAGAVRGHFGS